MTMLQEKHENAKYLHDKGHLRMTGIEKDAICDISYECHIEHHEITKNFCCQLALR